MIFYLAFFQYAFQHFGILFYLTVVYKIVTQKTNSHIVFQNIIRVQIDRSTGRREVSEIIRCQFHQHSISSF